MKKLYFLLALLCCAVTQLKADVIQPSTTLPSDGIPEHLYKMTNGHNLTLSKTTAPTQTEANYGYIAFYQVENVSNAYYIYNFTSRSWFTYNNNKSDSNLRDLIVLNSTKEENDYFHFNNYAGENYEIRPFNTSGFSSKYLNWNGGTDFNPLDGNTTLGLWQDNGSKDDGSRWTFDEVENPCFLISNSRSTWEATSTTLSTSNSASISNDNQKFGFFKNEDNTYLYSVGQKKFITKEGNLTEEPADPIYFAKGMATATNTFVIYFDNGHFINVNEEKNIIINGWGPGGTDSRGSADSGNSNWFTVAGSYELPVITPPVEPEPEPGVEPASEITTGVYEMLNVDSPSRGYLVHSTEYPDKIKLVECKNSTYAGLTYADRFHTSLNSYWYVYQSDKGNTYIFSLANGLFITDEGSQAVTLTATPEPVVLENKTDKVFNIKSSKRDYYLDAAVGWGNNADNIIWVNNNTDGGCPYSFYPATKEVNATMLSTALAAIQNAEKGPDTSADDLSEELAPEYGKVDIKGIKVCNESGKFSESTYDQYYQHWQSNDQINYWIGTEDDQDIYSVSSIINIKTFRENDKKSSDCFHHDGTDEHRIHFTLTNVLTGMQIEAAEGYNIVGYCFDYTASDSITDIDGIDGEIVSAAGTHHVEVKGIETSSTEILFGKSSNKDIVISHFYVFVRRGMLLTKNQFDRFSNLLLIPFAFTLAPQNNPEHHVYAPEGSDILDACGPNCKKHSDKTVTGTDLKQQFVLLPFDSYWINYPSYNGMYFLYNLGAKKFVSAEGGKAILTEYPIQAASIEAGEEGFENCFRINFNKTNLLNVSTGYCNSSDATSSCVITNHNTYDGGNHFYLRAVREFDYEPGDVSNQIFAESYYIEDLTLLNEKGAELKAILDQDGPGYPTDDLRETLTQYYNNVTTYKEATAFFGLSHFLPEYKSTTSVKMPENGKAYRIKTHYNGTLGRYLKAAEGGVLSVVNEGQHKTDNSTVFVARSIDEAANGEGTFAFVGENGQFLVGARTGTQGFVPTYNDGGNTGDLCVSTAANKGDYFGGFILKTTEGTNTYNLQLGAAGTGTNLGLIYDAENPNSIINDPNGGSSIFFLEEVSYPNEVQLREPTLKPDGNSYSSIWLPFSVDIPEGVRVYKAHVDKANNQLVCGEVKNHLPAGNGAIIIGSEETKITLVPSIADMAPLQDNDLKGTNVTLARNQNVTTFVLNGGKGEIGFYPYTGTNIAKYKAYVEVDKAQAAQGLRFSFGTATDIESTLTEGEGEAKEYYDLSGRRVAHPTKGLYIVNGKKMYIK